MSNNIRVSITLDVDIHKSSLLKEFSIMRGSNLIEYAEFCKKYQMEYQLKRIVELGLNDLVEIRGEEVWVYNHECMSIDKFSFSTIKKQYYEGEYARFQTTVPFFSSWRSGERFLSRLWETCRYWKGGCVMTATDEYDGFEKAFYFFPPMARKRR